MKKILCSLLIAFSTFSVARAQTNEYTRIMKEGIALHDSGKYKEAIEKYNEAMTLDPSSGTAYYEIAFSYQNLQDYANAIKYADLAISKGGDTELAAYTIKGSAMDDAGDTKGAIKIYEKALKKFPDNYLLHFNYGISCARTGEADKAEASYVKALQLNATHPGSNLLLANLNLDKGNKTKGMLGLYFFLLLENNTERAKTAFERLHEVLYSGVSTNDDGKNTTITLNPQDDNGMATELGLKIMIMESAKKNGDKNRYERMAIDTDSFFKLASEIDVNKKKKKKSDLDIWSDIYIPVFYGLQEKGYTEAFVYHIASVTQDELVSTWIENNQDKMNTFYKWIEDQN